MFSSIFKIAFFSDQGILQVFVANVGDAKAVVARSSTTEKLSNNLNGGSSLKAIVLTREHKAIYPQERARIQKVRIIMLLLLLLIRNRHSEGKNYEVGLYVLLKKRKEGTS